MKARPQERALFLPQTHLCPITDEGTATFSSAFTSSRPHPDTNARTQMRAHNRRLARNPSFLLFQQHTLDRSHPQTPEHARCMPDLDEGTHTSLKSRTFALSNTLCPNSDEGTIALSLTILLSTTYPAPSPPSTMTSTCPTSDEGTTVYAISFSAPFTFSPPILDDETSLRAEYTLCPIQNEGTSSYTGSYTISSPKALCPNSDEGTCALLHTDSTSITQTSSMTFTTPFSISTTTPLPPSYFLCPNSDEGTYTLAFTPAESSTYSHPYPIPFTPSDTPAGEVEKTMFLS